MKKENTLKIGDVVELKSGSPKMTIEEIDEQNATVVWFMKDGHENRGSYRVSSLRIWKPKPISGPIVV